jgi:hypothetical protein
MSVARTLALGATLAALAVPAAAQLTATPSNGPMQRPFGSVPLVLPPDVPTGRGETCETDCLTGLATGFMAALVKQDGSGLKWAPRVRYAENGVPMMIGDGVWATATAHGANPLIVADAMTGKVLWLGTVDEHGQPGFYAMELTARRGMIADVATWIRRKEGRPPFGDPVAFRHDPAFSAALPKGKETARPLMNALVQSYFGAQLGKNAPPPFAKGCVLIENGAAMTGNLPAAKGETGDCASSHARGLFKEFEDAPHRVVAVDEARGLVVVSGRRDLPAAQTEFAATDGKPYKAEANYPRSMGFVTVFKIEGGVISRVETLATELPYLMPPPWRDGPMMLRRAR